MTLTPDRTVTYGVNLIACGMFLWDYSVTLWFDLKFVRGKMKLRWPLIPYFLTRYTTLGFVIGCLIYSMSRHRVDCDAIYLSGNFLGKAAVASASINLVVRTVIIWSYRWYIVLLLGVLVVGEFILIGIGLRNRGFFAAWDQELQYCISSHSSQKNDLGLFALYALCVDCIIVFLTIFGLRKFEPTSGFAAVLVRQGLSFFLLVLFFQTFVAVAVFTRDNVVFVSIASVPCAMVIPMVSCHLVRSILGGSYSTPGQCASSHGSSMTARECLPGDGVQLTTRVELGSSPC